MKIKRQDEKEQYDITVDWIKDFASSIEHNPNMLNNIKHLILKDNRFNTIDEKLADIKQRVGFDLIKNIESVEPSQVVTASKHSDEDIRRMDNILKYIKEMVKHESHLSAPEVISKCRQEEGLKFDRLKIDMGKLRGFIDKLIDENKEPEEEIVYRPGEEEDFTGDQDDSMAAYWLHSQTST